MSDYLDVLARVAQITIESEYYDAAKPAKSYAYQPQEGNFRLPNHPGDN